MVSGRPRRPRVLDPGSVARSRWTFARAGPRKGLPLRRHGYGDQAVASSSVEARSGARCRCTSCGDRMQQEHAEGTDVYRHDRPFGVRSSNSRRSPRVRRSIDDPGQDLRELSAVHPWPARRMRDLQDHQGPDQPRGQLQVVSGQGGLSLGLDGQELDTGELCAGPDTHRRTPVPGAGAHVHPGILHAMKPRDERLIETRKPVERHHLAAVHVA
jgi:hypothetical protein